MAMQGAPGQMRSITPDLFMQSIQQMKKAMSQSEGEVATARQEVISNVFQNFVQLGNAIFSEMQRGKVAMETLSKIYQAHPDIKIAMDAEAKKTAQGAQTKPVKKTKK